MPYIKSELRSEVLLSPEAIVNAGELNYYISSLINHFIDIKGKSYATINEVIGALECAKLELYRRIAAPYEDIKIKENGEVYTKLVGD
jgi:cystathionine beta-lyase family protein involved in aluminum resistance